MLLKNNSARLISINASGDEQDRIDLLPAGAPVEVSKKLCDSRYVKALLQVGSIVKVDGVVESDTDSDDPLGEMTVADLKTYADSLEIEYGSSVKKDDLKALIEEHQKNAE